MDRFYFDWIAEHGERTADHRGVSCADLEDAKAEARRALAEWARDGGDPEAIEIRDKPEGEPLCFVSLRAT